MNTFQVNDTVGDVVASCPVLSRVFDEAGIDYCCVGPAGGAGAVAPQKGQRKHRLVPVTPGDPQLLTLAPQLHVRRQRSCKLDQPVVEQRLSRLEAVRHRRAI